MSRTSSRTRRAATAYDLDGLRAAVNDVYSPLTRLKKVPQVCSLKFPTRGRFLL